MLSCTASKVAHKYKFSAIECVKTRSSSVSAMLNCYIGIPLYLLKPSIAKIHNFIWLSRYRLIYIILALINVTDSLQRDITTIQKMHYHFRVAVDQLLEVKHASARTSKMFAIPCLSLVNERFNKTVFSDLSDSDAASLKCLGLKPKRKLQNISCELSHVNIVKQKVDLTFGHFANLADTRFILPNHYHCKHLFSVARRTSTNHRKSTSTRTSECFMILHSNRHAWLIHGTFRTRMQ